ncbi:MAG: hypothetical protein JW900_01030 [Anaerolineae bacterium]|nr:hypothetical protein [Anaerolineae bacterium]
MMMRRFLLWWDVRRLAVALLFVGLFAMAIRAPADTDTWWHLQAGRWTVDQARVLQTDYFSHTRYGSPWVNHSWLSQVLMYLLFEHFSYAGLGLWMGAVIVVSFALVYPQMEGDPFTRAFILVIAAATSSVIWVARPQLLSFLLTAAVAYVLYLYKWRRVNRLWLLPPIMVLWVNLHAGYALGYMLLVAFVAGEVVNHVLAWLAPDEAALDAPRCPPVSWRRLAWVVGFALLSLLLLVINPNTTRMWVYYLDTVSVGVLQDFIQEWQSPNFHPLYAQPFIWVLLATLGAMGLSGRRVDGTDLATLAMFSYAALMAGRNLGPFALVAAPVLSRHVAAALKRWGISRRPRPPGSARSRMVLGGINLALLAIAILLALLKVWSPLGAAFNEQLQRESLPAGAVEWIQENRPAGRMFNHYNWGGYLIWRLWPDYLVFVDGRTDLYGDQVLRDYLEIQRGGPQALALLDHYDVYFVLTPTGDGLCTLLSCQQDWTVAYRDEMATIWVRNGEDVTEKETGDETDRSDHSIGHRHPAVAHLRTAAGQVL